MLGKQKYRENRKLYEGRPHLSSSNMKKQILCSSLSLIYATSAKPCHFKREAASLRVLDAVQLRDVGLAPKNH